jgi:hypothetical protein
MDTKTPQFTAKLDELGEGIVFKNGTRVGTASFANKIQSQMFCDMLARGAAPGAAALHSGAIYLSEQR